MNKIRLDQLIVQQGLAPSREKAQRLILAGQVRVNGQPGTKAGHAIPADAVVTVAAGERFVSRGGDKLEAAFEHFHPDVAGKTCLDVGASTGGFTDCMLQHGAARVFAVDVGHGQLDARLRADPRVLALEKINARHLTRADLPATPDFATADVSFISLTKILPAITNTLADGGYAITLIKPQFEAGREEVERGGVVRDPAIRARVVENLREWGCRELGLRWIGVIPSPLKGPAGNVEFLAYWGKA